MRCELHLVRRRGELEGHGEHQGDGAEGLQPLGPLAGGAPASTPTWSVDGRRLASSGIRSWTQTRPQCSLLGEQDLCPRLATHRPSLDRVGVLAGARPADGPSGCNPSAPSCWCSPCPSSSPHRRNRCLPTPLARLAQPPRSSPAGCCVCMAGDHRALRWKLFFVAAKRQHAAAAWWRGEARAARHAHASVCAEAREGPRTRSGRRWVVEPDDHSRLAGPPGHTAEQGGLWSPWVSSKVGV